MSETFFSYSVQGSPCFKHFSRLLAFSAAYFQNELLTLLLVPSQFCSVTHIVPFSALQDGAQED
jgi:hypothetical protein